MIDFEFFALFTQSLDASCLDAVLDVCKKLEKDLRTREELSLTCPSGFELYRARQGFGEITHKRNEDFFDFFAEPIPPEKMGPPPHELTSAGRFNQKGRPVLYLATTPEVALAEVRAASIDPVTVGKFSTNRQTKLVDLTVPTIVTPDEMLHPEDTMQFFWRKIAQYSQGQFSQDHRTASYMTTQMLASVFRKAGFDGIRYRSSFAEPSWLQDFGDYGSISNIVLFSGKDAECVESKLMRIERTRPKAVPY